MNNSTVEGKFDQMKGKIKQAVGETTGNETLANSGAADQVKGAAKETWGNVKDAAEDVKRTNGTYPVETARPVAEDSHATAHDIREKIVESAQNAKDSIKNTLDRHK
jgi:uncharacterized protein YjbJ (UPF0337 family)